MLQYQINKLICVIRNINKLTIFISLMFYNFLTKLKKPDIFYNIKKMEFILKMRSIHRRNVPFGILPFGTFHTVLQILRPVLRRVSSSTLYIETPQDGIIKIEVFEKEGATPSKNILLVHGFNGSSESTYIRGLSELMYNMGWRVFRFNSRGTRTQMRNGIFFHIGWTVDLKAAVDHILKDFKGDLEIYGFSLGASWVTKYFGEEELDQRIVKGGAICVPFDFNILKSHINKWYLPRLYNRILTRNYKKYIKRNPSLLLSIGIDQKTLDKCKNVEDIDRMVTMKAFSIDNLDLYYKEQSCVNYIQGIKKPFLILNSQDDPIIPAFSIPKKKCEENENILLVITRWGGHLGFLTNFRRTVAEDIIMEFSEYFK